MARFSRLLHEKCFTMRPKWWRNNVVRYFGAKIMDTLISGNIVAAVAISTELNRTDFPLIDLAQPFDS